MLRLLLPPRYAPEFVLAMIAMLLFGALDMIRGVVAPTLLHDFGLDFTALGILLSASSSGYLISSFVSGFLVDRWGLKGTLLLGNVLILAGVGGTILSSGFVLLSASFLLSGLGNGMMEIGTNSIVPFAANGAQSRFFNILHATYGIGATFSPLVAGYALEAWKSWKLPYIGVAILLVLVLGVTLFLHYPEKHALSGNVVGTDEGQSVAALPALGPVEVPEVAAVKMASESTVRELVRRTSLYLLLIGITVYVVAEVGFSNWLPTLLHATRHMSANEGAAFLTGFYLLYTIGRFAGSLFVHKVGSERSVVISAVIALLLTGLGLWMPGRWSYLLIAAGLFFGIIFPTISSIAAENYTQRTGTVLGFLFACAGLGATLSSWVIGRASDMWGLTMGFSTVLVGLLVTAVVIALFPWVRARELGYR